MSMMNGIIGVLASRERKKQYYTTVLYPELSEDNLSLSSPQINSVQVWENPNDGVEIPHPTIVDGILTAVVNYVTYENAQPDNITAGIPTVRNGTLATIVNYVTYTAEPDNITAGIPNVRDGVLVTTINYVTYNNATADNITAGVPTIMGGILA